MRKARLIYNPVSGKEIMRTNLADILDAIEKAGYEQVPLLRLPSLIQLKMKQPVPQRLVLS